MKPLRFLSFAFLLLAILITPVQAGEPTGKIGPLNPTMFRCVDEEDGEIIADRLGLEAIEEIADEDPTTLDSMCTSTVNSDFGFNPADGAELQAFINRLEDDCDRQGGELQKIEDTRIEGYVYEFHPDVQNPGQWFAVPSRDVPVVAKGIGFEVFWGSEIDGYYYFPNEFGAGPIVLSLRLPPDAHPVNPNVVINSTGLEETWTVFLGFYRGDQRPPDVTQLQTPDGNFLPFTSLTDLAILSQCGYMDLPEVAEEILPLIEPPKTITGTVEIPNVGGVLSSEKPFSIMALALLLAIGLPVAGILKIRRKN
jgi:hypothetical protein